MFLRTFQGQVFVEIKNWENTTKSPHEVEKGGRSGWLWGRAIGFQTTSEQG